MRFKAIPFVVLAAGTLFYIGYLVQRGPKPAADAGPPAAPPTSPPPAPEPVAVNRGADVRDGFRGDVHPLLTGQTRLGVAAEWTPVGQGRDGMHRDLNPKLYAWFTELKPARPRQTYTERDFSAFLPETIGEVGQTWALDEAKVAAVLTQFHPRPRMHLTASGRRAGPDGSFALLRAVSPASLDIIFRVHTEFYLTPDDWPASQPLVRAWYTPAYLNGHLVVNREAGTVEYFRLGLANDKALNVHLTVAVRGLKDTRQAHDIVRVEKMELAGGDAGLVERTAWTASLPEAEAEHRLARVFYKSLDIEWLSLEEAAAQSKSQNRPLFAVVSWGSFEDQSC